MSSEQIFPRTRSLDALVTFIGDNYVLALLCFMAETRKNSIRARKICDWLISKFFSKFCLGGLGSCDRSVTRVVLKTERYLKSTTTTGRYAKATR